MIANYHLQFNIKASSVLELWLEQKPAHSAPLVKENMCVIQFPVKELAQGPIIHPDYDIFKKKGKGADEFYDYDVALLKLESPVTISMHVRWVSACMITKTWHGLWKWETKWLRGMWLYFVFCRPICIPCTKSSIRATGLSKSTTCKAQGERYYCLHALSYKLKPIIFIRALT